MSTIPQSHFSSVTPGVVSAGGSAVDLSGLFLTTSTRVPIGTVLSLVPLTVGSYFGPTSKEAGEATVYGRGFDGCTKYPAKMLFVQYPIAPVAAWLRGGNFSGVSLAAMQAMSGTLSLDVDGYAHTASVNLTTANSPSDAANMIAGALAGGTAAAVISATISSTTLTVASVTSGALAVGQSLTGTNVTAGTVIVGGSGTSWTLNVASTVGTAESMSAFADPTTAVYTATISSKTMTVSAVAHGTLAVGQTVTGAGVTTGSVITGLGIGTTGGDGTYTLSAASTVNSGETMAAQALQPTIAYDSVSGGFLVTSALTGTLSTTAFATGTLAAPLMLTSATGAVLSQGAVAASPATFMDAVIQINQNWGGFTTLFDPDGGSGNTQKVGFAAWKTAQNNQYLYADWDTDQSPVVSAPAPASQGAILAANGDSGTCLISEPGNLHLATFVLSYCASLNFSQKNGAFNAAYRSQAGLTASVSTLLAAENLEANGYSYYGAEGGRNPANNDTFFYPGYVTGPFKWLNSYVQQMWLNAGLQQAGLGAQRKNGTLPYNSTGYSKLRGYLLTPITAAINYGAIQTGVTLSPEQIAEVNSMAGKPIDTTLSHQGWYLLISDADPVTRVARTSPLIIFLYVDGGQIQKIDISSLMVQ